MLESADIGKLRWANENFQVREVVPPAEAKKKRKERKENGNFDSPFPGNVEKSEYGLRERDTPEPKPSHMRFNHWTKPPVRECRALIL